MSYIVKQGENTDYQYKEIIVDTETEISTIDNTNICPGSVVYVIASGSVYILNSEKMWVRQETSTTDPQDATATAEDIVRGKTAYVNGEKIEGLIEDRRNEVIESDYTSVDDTDTNNISINGQLSYASNICVSADANVETIVPKSTLATSIGLTADKIKNGETILGVTGTYEGSGSATTVNTTLNLQLGERYNGYNYLPYMTFENLNSASFDITQLYNWNRNNRNGTPISQTILEMPYVYLQLEIREVYELEGGLDVTYELFALDKPLVCTFDEYGSEVQVAKNCYKASMRSDMFTNVDYDFETGEEYIPEGKNYATFNEFWTDFCNSIYSDSAIKCVKPTKTTTYEADTIAAYLYSNLV